MHTKDTCRQTTPSRQHTQHTTAQHTTKRHNAPQHTPPRVDAQDRVCVAVGAACGGAPTPFRPSICIIGIFIIFGQYLWLV